MEQAPKDENGPRPIREFSEGESDDLNLSALKTKLERLQKGNTYESPEVITKQIERTEEQIRELEGK